MVGDVIRGVPPERRVRRWLSRRHSSLALRRSALLLVVTLLGTVMGSLTGTQPASASVGDYRDEFLTAAFDGDDGTLTWSTDWIESGESNGPGDGSIQILVNSYCSQTTCLVLGRNGGEPDAGIEREADFAGVGTAILRFDYKRHKHGGAGQVDLEVSANGGIDWDALDAWSLTATDGEQYTPSYDISAYTSANTRIRFRVTGSTDDSHLNVDNLEIVGSAGTPDTYLKGDGVPSASLGSAPVQVTLPNHDPGYDNEPGRLVKKTGGGLNEVDATKYQQWVAPALQRSLNGPVLLGLWSAMKDFKVGKRGWFEAGLYDCRPGGSECNLLASAQLDLADWSGGTADWVYREIDFGSVTATIPPGRSLAVKVVVDNSADDDMWLAYDTVSYPSRLSVTLANQPPTFDQDLGDRSDAGGSLITIASPATDPNLSALTYTATGLPQGDFDRCRFWRHPRCPGARGCRCACREHPRHRRWEPFPPRPRHIHMDRHPRRGHLSHRQHGRGCRRRRSIDGGRSNRRRPSHKTRSASEREPARPTSRRRRSSLVPTYCLPSRTTGWEPLMSRPACSLLPPCRSEPATAQWGPPGSTTSRTCLQSIYR